MRILTGTIALGMIVGIAGPALADPDGWPEGWYAGAEGGVSISPKLTFSDNPGWNEKQNDGFAVAGQVGYAFNQFRLEAEVGWLENKVNELEFRRYTSSASGEMDGLAVMGNIFYDIQTRTPLTPYLGVGIGGINVAPDKIRNSQFTVTNSSSFTPGGQLIAGVSYALNSNWAIKADYRYIRTLDTHLPEDPSFGYGKGHGDYRAQAVMAGFTYSFGTPPAPVRATSAAAPAPVPVQAPPPPPPPPKKVVVAPITTDYMVFFDFDKSVITPEASQTIDKAIAAFKSGKLTTIALTGYTDSVGTVAYNLKLSVRRGEAVKAALVAQGIPANEISVVGKGKSDQLVPTKDGVREPQNRRVTIVLN